MANITASKLQDVLKKHVDAASVLMTDELGAYARGGKRFTAHKTVDHSREEYAYRERKTGLLVTTNSAESYFALFKRGIYGTFHNISEAHLDRYLAEFDFRANTRELSDSERCAAFWPQPRGGDWCMKILTAPRTPKQKARASLRSTRKRDQD